MAEESKKKKNTAELCTDLAKPIADEMGMEIWDVRFEKEGTEWFLRYYMDKENLMIDDLEAFSRKMSDILDEADPIPMGYTLEVCSPGLERRLVTEEHVRKYLGYLANIRFIRAPEGYNTRDFLLQLDKIEDGVVTASFEDGKELTFPMKSAAKITLYYDFDNEMNEDFDSEEFGGEE